MEIPFNFNETAIGIDFLGRDLECNSMLNLIRQRQNVLIYGPDGIGKKSLVNKVFIELQRGGANALVCNVDLHNIRTERDFCSLYAERVSLCGLNSYSDSHEISAPLADAEEEAVLRMPEALAEKSGQHVVIYFEEFQNILHFDDPDAFLKKMEKCWSQRVNVTYLVSGSKVNAMKYIFEEKKYFYGQMEYLPIRPLSERESTEYVIRTFLRVGRVIDKSFVKTYYDVSGGNPYYLWLLSYFSFNMTKGYVTPDIREFSIRALLSLKEEYFKSLIDSLSNFQLSLLRAIFNGVTRFSNKEVIEQYGLNSSANVHRLKEALKKKEIIYFDEKDDPQFIDPIFKYWLSKCYFV